MFTGIVTTMDKYTEPVYTPGTHIIDTSKTKNGLKEYQKVIAIGDSVRNVKVGDLVCINPSRYAVKTYSKDSLKESMDEYYNAVTKYNFNVVHIDGQDYLMLQENDIDFIVTKYEYE